VITDVDAFICTIEKGIEAATNSKLVTFGVVPTHPETGYGYIQKGTVMPGGESFSITQFVEKPDLATAQRYLQSGEYYWNSGMFLFSAATFLQELLTHDPALYHPAKRAMEKARACADFIRPDPHEFEHSCVQSIDCAVMEKTHQGVVFPLQCQWNDVGAWDSLAKLFPEDQQGNACSGDVIVRSSENCLVQSHHRLVVTVGVRDLIIVETSDAILVMDKAHSQEVKEVVATLRADQRKEVIFQRRVNRPWGAFESIDQGERFQVKRITVAVGQKLSLQRHRHRSEHWIVVKGIAKVVRGDELFTLTENQSTYIPIGVDHRLENGGKIPLEIIEVQSGAYLGEDDIIRLEDQYGRVLEPV
jgi:mannose-1-phosphate guanylyltransferase/mannose-6-phosphate isomerase